MKSAGAGLEVRTLYAQGVGFDLLHGPEVRPTVFSLFLANSLSMTGEERRACDLGTGCGILAIVLARLGVEQVTAVDHEAAACEIAAENVRRNGVSGQVEIVHGELSDLELSGFDLAVSNPPTMPAVRGAPGFAWGGGDDLEVVRLIAAGLDRWLAPSGRAQIALSSLVGPEALGIFKAAGFTGPSSADLLAPFRPFYADCYDGEQLDSFVAAGRALRDDDDDRALSEVISVYSLTRAGGQAEDQMPSLGS